MEGGRCEQPGCGGVIEGGFCNRCGLEPAGSTVTPPQTLAPPPLVGQPTRISTDSALAGSARSSVSRRGSSGVRTSQRRPLGLGFVTVPPLPVADPERAVMANPEVPAHKRFCGNPDCVDATGQPTPLNRRQAGHCPNCGRRYSFVPTLQRGDVVAEQYEVRGCLAYGGLGWIYLARDTALDRWVVLKGLLNAADEDAATAAVAERQFLAAVKHPNIVGVYNFVKRGTEGFIVMEYINGTTVKDLRKQRGPLPPAEALAYIHRVLGSFAYLHRQGLVYCDFKPDNFMLEGDPPDVKLIDMGGVRRLDDPGGDIYGTRGYSAPEAGAGPTVVSDLFTVGRTLAVLLMDFRYQSQYEFTLPPAAEQPLLARHESLHRALLRATAQDPDRRFQSAEEMADQLGGVLREIVAGTGEPRPFESSLFGGDVLALRTDGSAALTATAALLPDLEVNPEDQAAGFLLSLAAVTDPTRQAALLADAAERYEDSREVPLLRARSLIDLGQFADAEAELGRIEARDPFEWRVTWLRGRSLLAQGKVEVARLAFDQVYAEVPGELAAKLAVAVAAEADGDRATAARFYDLVSRTDPGFPTAAFGLARCLEQSGRRREAVEAYGRVPLTSSLYTRAQMALARALIRSHPTAPGIGELTQAAAVVEALNLQGDVHARLRAEILDSAVTLLAAGALAPDAGVKIFGGPLLERPLRRALEQALRQVARFETDRPRQVALIDRANAVRPWTWL